MNQIIDAGCDMRDYVLLYVNGRRYEARGSQAFLSLSEFLRTSLRLTGTKVVCAEGDCGSCSVLVGRPTGEQIEYRSVTSCIQYIAQLDGTHVVTVEGLAPEGRLNGVQAAMVECHGAQCGYCTPGIVVSLADLLDHNPQASRHEVCRALVGNLCRCTGYAAILEAASRVVRGAWQRTAERYADRAMHDELARAALDSVAVTDGLRRVLKPAIFVEALALRAREPAATVLAGGTDLGVHWNKGRRDVGTLLCIGHLSELHGNQHVDGIWTIGAATTLAEVERMAGRALPAYASMLERFGSPPIKNAGTLGGNLANGSPIGDSMPALMVLDALVELVSAGGSRQVNINQFYTGYRQTVMAADELIARVVVPLPARGDLFAAYKVTRRRDLDISAFTAAVWMQVENGRIGAARIALGGVGPTIVRLARTESWLVDQELCETAMRQAGRMARDEIAPISDVRGSSEYRSRLAENIFLKFFYETRTQDVVVNGRG